MCKAVCMRKMRSLALSAAPLFFTDQSQVAASATLLVPQSLLERRFAWGRREGDSTALVRPWDMFSYSQEDPAVAVGFQRFFYHFPKPLW